MGRLGYYPTRHNSSQRRCEGPGTRFTVLWCIGRPKLCIAARLWRIQIVRCTTKTGCIYIRNICARPMCAESIYNRRYNCMCNLHVHCCAAAIVCTVVPTVAATVVPTVASTVAATVAAATRPQSCGAHIGKKHDAHTLEKHGDPDRGGIPGALI